jgi:dephospho-CoA kinase
MKIIGLTGGIGSGKSTAASLLAKLGAEIVDLDKVGNEALKKGNKAYKKAVQEFGDTILGKNGEIDRSKLGRIVFRDREALQRLNNIVHPEIDKVVAEKTKDCPHRGVKVMVLEAAAIMEADKAWQMDEMWAIIAPEKAVIERLKQRSGYYESETKARIHSQMPNEEKAKRANVVINNNGSLDNLKAQVKAEWEKLLKRL